MENPRETRFGDWTLLRASGELLRDGRRIRLQDHPLKVLEALLERPGELVTREELIARLWPNQVVDFDTALNTAVRRLRATLGDDAGTPRYVETVPRRGYRFIGPVASPEPSLPGTLPPADEPPAATAGAVGARARGVRIGLALAAIAIVAGAWLAQRGRPAAPPDTSPAASKSIVVLPFVNLSADEGDQLFADGLTEELINRLAENSGTRVVARTTSFALRDKGLDVAAVAAKVGVTHVLEGSVRRAGERVRVTAQLIDAADSTHVWSRNYDRATGDLFEIQDDIASRVATALHVRLATPSAPEHRPIPAAYEKYLIARHLFARRGEGDVAQARDYFEEATKLDPGFARAFAGLASAYWILVAEGRLDAATGHAGLERAANRALELNPRLAEPHVRLALRAYAVGDPDANAEHWRMAKELEPENPIVKSAIAREKLADQGVEGELAIARLFVESDPLSVVAHYNLAVALYIAGRYEDALSESRKALELSPTHRIDVACQSLVRLARFAEARTLAATRGRSADGLQCLALAEHGLGDDRASDAALSEIAASGGELHAYRLAEAYAFRGDSSAAFEWLQRHMAWCTSIPNALRVIECSNLDTRPSPLLAPLASDPRWANLHLSAPVRIADQPRP
jgi:TolB-like protein/DNA-binding winged helix-turn-helix (wHTH) protein